MCLSKELKYKKRCAVLSGLVAQDRKSARGKLQPDLAATMRTVIASSWAVLATMALLQVPRDALYPPCGMYSLFVDCWSHYLGCVASMWAITASMCVICAMTWDAQPPCGLFESLCWKFPPPCGMMQPLGGILKSTCGMLQSPWGLRVICVDCHILCVGCWSLCVGYYDL